MHANSTSRELTQPAQAAVQKVQACCRPFLAGQDFAELAIQKAIFQNNLDCSL